MTQTTFSRVQVLVVENEPRKSKRTGVEYTHFAARCIMIGDDDRPLNVGTLRSDQVLPELRDKIKPGNFRLAFGTRVADWGEDKGDIVSIVVDVQPDAVRQAPPAPMQAPGKV